MSVQKKITWVFANSMKRNEEQTADHRNPMCFVPCVFIFLLEATLDETIFPFATGFAFISSFFFSAIALDRKSLYVWSSSGEQFPSRIWASSFARGTRTLYGVLSTPIMAHVSGSGNTIMPSSLPYVFVSCCVLQGPPHSSSLKSSCALLPPVNRRSSLLKVDDLNLEAPDRRKATYPLSLKDLRSLSTVLGSHSSSQMSCAPLFFSLGTGGFLDKS